MDNEIIEAIETKGRLASGYDWRGATEKWLLLVAEGHGLTDVIGDVRQIALPPAPKSSPFTSILVWDKFSEDIWAVFPEFALMCDGSHQGTPCVFSAGGSASVCDRRGALSDEKEGTLMSAERANKAMKLTAAFSARSLLPRR